MMPFIEQAMAMLSEMKDADLRHEFEQVKEDRVKAFKNAYLQ